MNFILVLFFVIVISYGQILGMHVWQDDNGLFFKLAHINEPAGYFGIGPFGTGTYKYTIAPYIPIYKIFGYATFPYFFLNLILYSLSVICVYKVFSRILGEKGGKIAGFLYAAGYIASDGIIRLFSSPLFSLSIILISLFLLSYWNYYRWKKIGWYFFAVLFFFLAIEFIRARTHYLIGVAILFELIFFSFRQPLKSTLQSLLRLIPFAAIFYQYYVLGADHRTGQIKIYVLSILNGDFQKLYGLVSSWSNLVFPDWLTNKLFLVGTRPLWFIAISVLVFILALLLLRKNLKSRILFLFFVLALGIWTIASKTIFTTTLLNLGAREIFIAFLGGALIIIFFAVYFVLKRFKNLYLLLFAWAVLNILAYSAYNPTASYESINRYLTHSFFPLVGMFSIFSVNVGGKNLKIIIMGLIIAWGLGNVINSAIYQNRILTVRSNPVRNFYQQLKKYVPSVKKGDVFYFDVAPSDRSYYNDAFSVASMPETTALAWRYGVDRYDIKLFTSFDELNSQVKEGKVDPKHIYSFWYSGKNLSDTSVGVRKYFLTGLPDKKMIFDEQLSFKARLTKGKEGTYWENGEVVIDLGEGVESLVPTEVVFEAKSLYPNLDTADFPLVAASSSPKSVPNPSFVKAALSYGQEKNILMRANYESSSFWQERKIGNLNDSNTSTVWQPDRIKWKDRREWFQINLNGVRKVSKLVWINGFGNNTPTKYKVEVSIDGKIWTEVVKVEETLRIDDKTPRIIFFKPIEARNVRMTFLESLNGDSPGIAEAWVVSSDFENLDIMAAENFLLSPFSRVSDMDIFTLLASFLRSFGRVKVYWMEGDTNIWQTTEVSSINLIYDGNFHRYSITIPPKGLVIKKLKLADFTAPSEIIIKGLEVLWPRP